MKPFVERSPFVIGLAGLSLTVGTAVAALNYDRLPFLESTRQYSAYFSEVGVLRAGDEVQVAGFEVGKVSSVALDGDRVLVSFAVDDSVPMGELTEAKIRTKSLLGAKALQLIPRGEGHLSTTIPLERTTAPYELPKVLGDLSATINDLDTGEVSEAMKTLADTFRDTPEGLRAAVAGVGRFSETLGNRDAQLRSLLANARASSAVISERADEIARLVSDTNALLAQLQTESSALQHLSRNLSAFANQLSGLIEENKTQLRPALDKINGVLTILDNRKDQLVESIGLLNNYAMSLGESVASGPFYNAYLANLPGQLIQPFIDSAFSDLGLDPNVLLPSERTDPAVGQPGTPALPVPYPRTGQGGPPRLTVPDAITGNPGDRPCVLPGPGCYPYREPLPAPAPGGPPPGPPALPEPGREAIQPSPAPVYQPAPNEPPQDGQMTDGQS